MKIELHAEVAVLRLMGGRANAINHAFLDGLDRLLDEPGAQGARALVLTGYERFFSGGIDLPALLAFDRAAVASFMRRMQQVFLRVWQLERPVVAAINGHAVAGGCVLAMQADRRLMASGGAKIGLREVQLGLALPNFVIETLRPQLAPAAFGPVALEGRLFTPEEAKQIGLVEEVTSPEELEARAVALAHELGKLPRAAFAHIKRTIRAPAVEAILRADESWLETFYSEEAQRLIAETVQKLGR